MAAYPDKSDDLHPSLIKWDLGAWTMISERKMRLNFSTPTMNTLEIWKSQFMGQMSTIYSFLNDCRKIHGTPVFFTYMGYHLMHGLESTALLYAANQVMQTIEAGILAKEPDVQKILRTLGMQLSVVAVSETAKWAVQKLELSMRSRLKRHFMLLQMQAKLRLDYPTFQSTSKPMDNTRSDTAWRALKTFTDAFRLAVSTLSQLWFIFNLTHYREGSLLFSALCLVRPLFASVFGDMWSLVFVAHIGDVAYKRARAFYEMAMKQEYKEEVLTGGLNDYVLKEYETAAKSLGNKSDEHPYVQIDAASTPLFGITSEVLGELPTLYYAIHVVLHPGAMSLTSLAMLQQTSRSLATTFHTLAVYSTISRSMIRSISTIYDGFKLENTVQDGEMPYPNPDIKTNMQGMGVEFKSINFAYPGSTSDRLVLKNISFTIKPSSMVVIVGANGSGKSTLVKLLSSLYRPKSGSLLIDSLPSNAYRLSDLRNSTALLTQDHNLFPLTVEENIGIGDPSDPWNLDKTKEAAELGGSAGFIQKLEEGYEERVGQKEEVTSSTVLFPPGPVKDIFERLSKTSEISGGERQRLVASRTFRRILSGKTKLVLVDEPTSAMDPEGEFMLFERLRAMRRGNTMVFVTHRFGHLTKHADLILCMKDGELVESGTHRELIAQAGEYHKLYDVQARAFSDNSQGLA